MESVISERRLAESSGVPIEVSRKGKAPPQESGKGQSIPFPIEPDRVAAEAVKRRNNGFHPGHLYLKRKSTGPLRVIKI